MSGRDPMDMLRELGAAERAGFDSAVDPDAFLATLPRTRRARLRDWLRRRWRRLVASIVAGLVVIGGGTVTWAYVHRERATVPTTVMCYVQPKLASSGFAVAADGTEPTELCTRQWPDTGFGPPRSPLVACKASDGMAAVYPGSDGFCEQLGLTALDPTLSEQDQAIIAFQHQLAETATGLGCVTPDELADLARRTAAEVGLEGWTITVEPPTAEEPCGRFGMDHAGRIIYILSVPDLYGNDEGG